MDRDIWIAVCAHRLQRQWRTVDPEQLDELAADLWKDERLRALAPGEAATLWLEPLTSADGQHLVGSAMGGSVASPAQD